jgi:hypothetical protein
MTRTILQKVLASTENIQRKGLEDITTETIERTFDALGYPLDKKGKINTFGIRSLDMTAGYFNDILGLYWVERNGKPYIHLSSGTVDPGSYYLGNPMHKDGTMVLAFQYCEDAYMLGYHRGQYEALVQRKSMEYYRITKEEYEEDNIGREEGKWIINLKDKPKYFSITGCNQHRASSFRELHEIGRYSAGCQVRNNPTQYQDFLRICKSSKQKFFSYALFSEKRLIHN